MTEPDELHPPPPALAQQEDGMMVMDLEQTANAQADLHQQPSAFTTDQKPVVKEDAQSQKRLRCPLASTTQRHSPRDTVMRRQNLAPLQRQHEQRQQQWQQLSTTPTTLTTSFDSSTCASPVQQTFDPYQAQMGGHSMFPGNHDYTFPTPQYQQQKMQPQQMVQTHQVSHIPTPQFNTVPNTPTFSPGGFMYHQDLHLAGPGWPDDVQQGVHQQHSMMPTPQHQAPAGFVSDTGYGVDGTMAQHVLGDGMQYQHQQQGVQPMHAGMQHPQPSPQHDYGTALQYGGLPVNYMAQYPAASYQ